MLGSARIKLARRIRRLSKPLFAGDLRAALDRAIGAKTELLFVHSSLSSCGYFVGGPQRALRVLHEFADTLCLPTHTYSYPSAPGEPGPVFDASATPSEMGLLAETFWRQPGVVRSIHATHSLAASGPLAATVCAGHYQHDTPCGAGTPYHWMIQRRTPVLMLGVSMAYYTFFHTAEWLSGSAAAAEPGEMNRLRVRDEAGQVRECWSKRQGRVVPRFAEVGAMLERLGFVRRVRLGRASLLFIPDSLVVHEYLVERLNTSPHLLRTSSTEPLE